VGDRINFENLLHATRGLCGKLNLQLIDIENTKEKDELNFV